MKPYYRCLNSPLNYGTDRQTGEKTDYDYRIPLATTPCNLGGVRWWFICAVSKNGVYCGRRVGKLYLPPDAPSGGASGSALILSLCRPVQNTGTGDDPDHPVVMDG